MENLAPDINRQRLLVEGYYNINVEENKTIELLPQQGFMIPKKVLHRTRAWQRTVMLMIEGSKVKPTGD